MPFADCITVIFVPFCARALGSSILNEVRYVVSQQTETEIREVNILVDSMMTD